MTEQTIESLTARVGELEAENAGLRAQIKTHKGQATRARNEAAALRLEKSPERRKCGPLAPPKDAVELAAGRQRIADALAAGHVDVIASDGKRALTEIAPVRVNGDAWRLRPDGFLLTLPIEHEPGDIANPEVRIGGYGLFDEAGAQIAWRALPEPIRVPKNGRVRVENSIVF